MSEMPPAAPPPPSGPSGGGPYTLEPNDRTLAAIGYVIWIVAVVVLLMEDTKRKPLLKDNAAQAIGLNIASYGVVTILFFCGTAVTLGFGAVILWILYFAPLAITIYYGYLVYTQGDLPEIRWLTDFMAQQGWLETRKPV